MKGKKIIKMAKAIRKYVRRFPNCDDGCVFVKGDRDCPFSVCPVLWEFKGGRK